MAMQSVQKDFSGPDWPLGLIAVATAGTPVGIMSLVDSANVNDPATITPGTSGANEYTQRCNQIVFYGVKAGASHGLQPNTGNVYVMRKGVQGAGNRRFRLLRSDYFPWTGIYAGAVRAHAKRILAVSVLHRRG